MMEDKNSLVLLGYLGAVLFYGRFYLQWFVSERHGKSVIPVGFWYMSGAGSILLLLYGVFYLNSPVGALSHCFNSVIYARNLEHIWREQQKLTKQSAQIFHVMIAILVCLGMAMVLLTLVREYHNTLEKPLQQKAITWIWIGVGVMGQGLFALRFLIQWIVTEMKQQSIIPSIFWYISVVASLLLIASHAQRQEWLYAIGISTTLLVYLRNIYWIRRDGSRQPAE